MAGQSENIPKSRLGCICAAYTEWSTEDKAEAPGKALLCITRLFEIVRHPCHFIRMEEKISSNYGMCVLKKRWEGRGFLTTIFITFFLLGEKNLKLDPN